MMSLHFETSEKLLLLLSMIIFIEMISIDFITRPPWMLVPHYLRFFLNLWPYKNACLNVLIFSKPCSCRLMFQNFRGLLNCPSVVMMYPENRGAWLSILSVSPNTMRANSSVIAPFDKQIRTPKLSLIAVECYSERGCCMQIQI